MYICSLYFQVLFNGSRMLWRNGAKNGKIEVPLNSQKPTLAMQWCIKALALPYPKRSGGMLFEHLFELHNTLIING